MINSITSRGTFYDITGYIMPGFAVQGLTLLSIYAMGGESISESFVKKVWSEGGLLTTAIVVVLAYVLGHLINSISSVLLEKWILKSKFESSANWYGRVREEGGFRATQIETRAKELFHVDAHELKVFDILARAAEYLPNAFVSGFTFLSFYGMCRSLALLCFLSIPPIFLISFRCCTCTCEHEFICKIVIGLLSCTPALIVALAFTNQYLRFVKYYADYLASTLLCKGENEPVAIEKRD